MKRIPQVLTLAGVVLLVGSLIWWFQTFGFEVGRLKCLVVTEGMCRMSGIGGLFGGNPYNPIALWVALACLVVGLGLQKSGKF
jgi:hypothetical protein